VRQENTTTKGRAPHAQALSPYRRREERNVVSKVLKVVGTVLVACLVFAGGCAFAIWYDSPLPRLNDQVSAGDIVTLIVGLGQIGAALYVAWRVQRLLATEQQNHEQLLALEEQKFQRQHSLSERRKKRIEELYWQVWERFSQADTISAVIIEHGYERSLKMRELSRMYWHAMQSFNLLVKLVEMEGETGRKALTKAIKHMKTTGAMSEPWLLTGQLQDYLGKVEVSEIDVAERARKLYEAHNAAVEQLESYVEVIYDT